MRRLASVLVAALLGAATTAVLPAPADAASGYCAKGTGVTVVVDKGCAGRGTSVGCDPNGANATADKVVPRAGFSLTYVQRQPGFVCRIRGVPASDPCGNTPPANAYWGLFYSKPGSGTWTYASTGVGSLKVAKGGFIGWRWQSSNARTYPSTKPVSPASSAPKPKPKPSPTPSPKPSPRPGPKPATRATPAPTHATSASKSAAAAPNPSANGARAGEKAKQRAAHPTAKATARSKATSAKARRAATRAQQRATASESASSGVARAGASSSSDPTTSPRTNLTAGERAADDTGSGPMLPLLAGGLVLALAAAAGRLAWVRRRG